MDTQEIDAFVDRWIGLWNAGDVEGVLEYFADDVTFTSPTAAQIIEGSNGVVRGKAALRAYWEQGLRANPDLHFELVGTYVGIDTIVINYRNQRGLLVNEILRFAGPLIVEGHAAHLQSGPAAGRPRPSP